MPKNDPNDTVATLDDGLVGQTMSLPDFSAMADAPMDGTIVLVQGDHMLAMAARFRNGAWWRDNGFGMFTVWCKPERWAPMPDGWVTT